MLLVSIQQICSLQSRLFFFGGRRGSAMFRSWLWRFLQVLANAERPMILVGNTVLQGYDGAAVHQIAADMSLKLKKSKKVEKDWKVLNVLHRVGHLYACLFLSLISSIKECDS